MTKEQTITKCPICGGEFHSSMTLAYSGTVLDEDFNIVETGDESGWPKNVTLECDGGHSWDEIRAGASRDANGWWARMVETDGKEETIEIRCDIPGVTDNPACEGHDFSRLLNPSDGFTREDIDFHLSDICLDFDLFPDEFDMVNRVGRPKTDGGFYEQLDALIDQWQSAPFTESD